MHNHGLITFEMHQDSAEMLLLVNILFVSCNALKPGLVELHRELVVELPNIKEGQQIVMPPASRCRAKHA